MEYLMPFIKALPHRVQHYAILISTIGFAVYHYFQSRKSDAVECISGLFDYAVHLADSQKIDDTAKFEFAIVYIRDAFAKFKWYQPEYWLVKSMMDYQIKHSIEVALEAKKVGIKNSLSSVMARGIEHL